MLINRNDISSLRSFSTTKELVNINSIPNVFKEEFQRFFFSKTVVEKDGSLFAYPHDIKEWVFYISQKYND